MTEQDPKSPALIGFGNVAIPDLGSSRKVFRILKTRYGIPLLATLPEAVPHTAVSEGQNFQHFCIHYGIIMKLNAVCEQICSSLVEHNILEIPLLTNLSKAVAKTGFDEFSKPGLGHYVSGNVTARPNFPANSPKGHAKSDFQVSTYAHTPLRKPTIWYR